MSISRKIIKVFSILSVLFGVVVCVFAVLVALGVFNKELISSGISAADITTDDRAAGIMAGIQGLIQIIMGWCGIRGANRPSKIGPFFILTVLAIIFYAIILGLAFTSGGPITTVAIRVAWHVFMLIMAFNVRKEAQRF